MLSNHVHIPPKKQDKNENSLWKRVIFLCCDFFLVFTLIVLGTVLWFYWSWSRDMPHLPNKQYFWHVNKPVSITVLDKDGKQLAHRGAFYGPMVRPSNLPAYLPRAFIAIEDKRFYEHKGFDILSIFRAIWANSLAGETIQGGSTLTQQLVKNFVVGPERTFKRKFQEARLARKLEQHLSKQEILSLYMNRIYFGDGTYGIGAAARHYFGKSPQNLNLAEAALLAGLPKAPSYYAPSLNKTGAKRRARKVLSAMVDAGFITPQQAKSATRMPLSFISHKNKDTQKYGFIFDLALEHARTRLSLRQKNLTIRTTLNTSLQDTADFLLNQYLDKKGKSLNIEQGALIVMENKGAVRALIGGRSYRTSQFNRATQARRQPGSSFKPFVYARALEKGLSFHDIRKDTPLHIGSWRPKNYGGTYAGHVTLLTAFKRSINTVAVRLGQEVGENSVIDLARRFGIRSPLQPLPSLALGTEEVSLWEMTGAYAVFASRGLRHTPYLIESVQDEWGRFLYKRPDIQPRRVYQEDLALKMTRFMHEVVLSGTGRAAQPGQREAAGKTGTSQNWRDAWFMGFTTDYSAGVWLGNDNNTPMKKVAGGGVPAEIWADIMKAAHKDLPLLPLKSAPLSSPPPRISPLSASQDKEDSTLYYELANAFSLEIQE